MIKDQLRSSNRRSKKAREAFVSQNIGSIIAAQIFSMRMREGRKLTQKQLAGLIGTVQTRIPVLEDPNYQQYSIQTLRRIAAAFDVALIVRFASFSELEDWAARLSPNTIVVPSFEEEEEQIAATPTQEIWAIDATLATTTSTSEKISLGSPPSRITTLSRFQGEDIGTDPSAPAFTSLIEGAANG